MRENIIRRDRFCVATGEKDMTKLVPAHIVPLNESQLIKREYHYSLQNGLLLRRDLEQSYDLYQWIFDADGKVTPLYKNWIHKDDIKQINISKDKEVGVLPSMIEIHNKLAKNRAKHCCPSCWKYVGEVNLKDHQMSSCENLN